VKSISGVRTAPRTTLNSAGDDPALVKGTYAIYHDGHTERLPLKELSIYDLAGNSPQRGSFMEKMYYPRQPN
jgi:hypothetical protein